MAQQAVTFGVCWCRCGVVVGLLKTTRVLLLEKVKRKDEVEFAVSLSG